MKANKTDFDGMEKTRREYMDKIKALSAEKFDPAMWQKLKEFLYAPRKLGADVIIDDTTLRDGFQMAGLASPRPKHTFEIAHLLAEIGAERLETLIYAKTDQVAIKMIQDAGMGDIMAAWCRAAIQDVDLARKLDFKQVGISHPVSYIHFEKWPETSIQELVNRVVETVQYARDHGLRVFVHGEDSTRADWNFEKVFINAVAEAGAEVYRICDTTGCGLPDPEVPLPNGIPAKVRQIKKETKIPYVEIHAHDDVGNAVENTMAAIEAAARLYDKVYASTTFLGMGERSGNAETEKIIMNCYIRYGIKKWNMAPMRKLALLIKSSTNFSLPMNKAIVGTAAFSHESGVHLHGIEALPLTYEIFPPELVGQTRTIVVGKRSGKHGVKIKLEKMLGQSVDENDPRFVRLLEIIRSKFAQGQRRYPIKDDEFKQYAEEVGFKVG